MNIQLALFVFLTVIAVMINTLFLYKVYESGKYQGRYHSKFTLYNHKKWVSRFLFVTVATVLAVEGMIQTRYDWDGVIHLFDTKLGVFHAIFDFFYVSTLACMRFVYTGISAPEKHRLLFKVVFTSYVLVVITGVWLTIKLVG